MQEIKAYLVGDHAVYAEGRWLYTNDQITIKKILLVVVQK